ncbi:MAG TPA: hypothetical protein PK511_09460 [Chitinophagales bacterium]|nr:hypothetical protein [Chitinophagales bacterium]HNE45173.1 hypothetical protein [Chitinophagales bacterium]HNF70150.1 hypothetical protein [Chitinophagales bacterium]HNI54735.1 hypothetical protein [Chitinophagales bacterium]HNM07516.1 hypothetical protein [Chitinophagales bacterium]
MEVAIGLISMQEQVDEVYGNGNLNTALFWEYDLRLGRRWNIDFDSEIYESPYLAFGSNPIGFKDLLGNKKDWYKDDQGIMQFDPTVQSSADLNGEGEPKGVYVGNYSEEKTANGIAYYRHDGSIYYTNQTDGYNRIWNNSEPRNREQSGVILNEGVLVFPDYKNNSDTGTPDVYGYSFSNGLMYDPVSKDQGKSTTQYPVVTFIHSHFAGLDPGPSYYSKYGYGDLGYAAENFPNKTIIVLAWDNKVYGLISGPPPDDPTKWEYQVIDYTHISVTKLLEGYDFSTFMKKINKF